MRELRDILAAHERLVREGGAAVLGSVVRVEGSTYRRPGARVMVLPDDRMLGLVSGGCVEADLLERSQPVRETGTPRLVRYDGRAEGDILWGLGLGCGGAVEVWLERIDAQRPGPLPWLARWVAGRQRGAIATRFEGEGAGRRRSLGEDGRFDGDLVETGIDDALRTALERGRGGVEDGVCVEVFEPPLRLAVFGAGPDAEPVVRIAGQLGWDVVVVDGRPAFAKPERFPAARVLLREPRAAVAAAEVDVATFALVMTHHYLNDQAVLGDLLASPAGYIGLLGPRQRGEDLLDDLREQGLPVDADQRARIHAPAGLDIGADSPEQIALSILAEMLAVSAGRSGGRLRERDRPIHDPSG